MDMQESEKLAAISTVLEHIEFPDGVALVRCNNLPYWRRMLGGVMVSSPVDVLLHCGYFSWAVQLNLEDDQESIKYKVKQSAGNLKAFYLRSAPQAGAIKLLFSAAATSAPAANRFLTEAAFYLVDRARPEGCPLVKVAVGGEHDHGQDPAIWPLRWCW